MITTGTDRFGIWKEGNFDKSGEYQPAALLKICESKEDAEAELKNFDYTHKIEKF